MAIRTPIWLQSGTYSAELDRALLLLFMAPSVTGNPFDVRSGVLPGFGGNFAVTQTTTASMQLQVAAGVAVVQGALSSTQGAYGLINDATTNVVITAANTTNPRIDIVVLQVQDAAYSGSNNQGQLFVVAGTPAVSPVVPATPANSIVLARVAVPANASSISGSNITDSRPFTATRNGYNWGTAGSFPSAGAQVNDIIVHTGLKSIMRFNGSAWRQVEPAEVSDGSVRDQLTGGLHYGFRCYEADSGRITMWNGSNWDKVGGPVEVLYDNGNIGGSGLIGAGSTATVVQFGYTSPLGSQKALLDYNHTIISANNAGTIGTLSVFMNEIVVMTRVFNVGNPQRIGGSTEFRLLRGNNIFRVALTNSQGADAFTGVGSMRLTF